MESGRVATSAVRSPADALREVEDLYVLREEPGVREFLHSHPLLVPLLLEARAEIAVYFPDSLIALHVPHDPETGDTDALEVVIPTALPAEEALDRLWTFDTRWWLNAVRGARGIIFTNLEFV